MSEYDVGEAFLQITPSFRGVAQAIDRQAAQWGLSSGKAYSDAFNQQVRRQTAGAAVGPSEADAARQGEATASRYAEGFKAKLRATPDAEIGVKANTADANARLAATKAASADLGRSSPNIGVNVDAGPALAAIGVIRTALLGMSAGAVITPLIGGAASLLGPLTAAVGGIVGVGAASIPGLANVKNALGAQKTAGAASGPSAAQVALQQASAANQVTSAEEQLASAQRASLAAQQALTGAREAATRSLQDSANSVKDAQLRLTADQLAVTQAQQNLKTVNAASTSTDLQKRQAALALAQAQQQLAEQQVTLKRATEDNTKAQKAGVDGSPQVIAAQQQIASTGQQVTDAQRSLAQAHLSAAAAADRSSASANTLGTAMAKLTPAEQALLTATQQFKTAFTGWADVLEPSVLPLFTGGLAILSGLLPKLTPLIQATAGALGQIETRMAAAVTGPGFAQFLGTLTSLVGPTLTGIATIAGHLGTAFANVFTAFAPLSTTVLTGLGQLTSELAQATESPALKQFVASLVSIGPLFTQTLGDVGGLAGKLAGALAPLAGPVLSVIDQLAKSLGQLVTDVGPALAGLFDALAPVLDTIVKALGPALTAFIDALAPALASLTPALAALGAALAQGIVALGPALQPLATLISTIVLALAPMLPMLGQMIGTILPPLAGAFTQLVLALTPLIPLLLQLIQADLPVMVALLTALTWVISNILAPAINGLIWWFTAQVNIIKDVISWFGHLNQSASTVATAIVRAWSLAWGTVKSVWTDTRNWLSGEWKAFAGTAGRLWGDITGAVGKAWGAVTGAVSGVWADVEGVFTDAVNFVTQDILNPLIGILNDVLGVFGVHIGKIAKLGTKAHTGKAAQSGKAGVGQNRAYALGGVLPGYSPGVDNIALPRFLFSGGEGILVPEATRALGGESAINAINSMFSHRVPSRGGAFAGGGFIGTLGSIGSAIGGAISGLVRGALDKVKNAIRDGAASVAIAALKTAEAPVQKLLANGPSPFARVLANGVFDRLNSAVFGFIHGHVKAPAAGPLPTGEHLSLIRKALTDAHVADSGANAAAVNTIVVNESGWRPGAINRVDINAQHGDPSRGLMQTIGATFEAYRLASLPDDIYDPLANLVAGIRYAVSRYGSLENVPGVKAVAAGGSYVGYDSGGFLPPGLSAVFNGTGRPEPVLTPAQWAQLVNRPADFAGVRSDLARLTAVTAMQGSEFAGVLKGTARLANLHGRTMPGGR